jgi:hypothetical protein
MKKLQYLIIFVLPLLLTNCVVIDNTPGPNGRNGNAYFGIDYGHHSPYSYWDNNNAIPYNPIFGEYYHTNPGIYEFEYFINENEYWYGTYQIWINYGGVGGSHGERGYDGADSYLMLITDPEGFYEERSNYRLSDDEPLVIEKKDEKFNYKITIQKGNTATRAAHEPKFIRN